MGKPLRAAILDGAQQIAVPAFVSTLASASCSCRSCSSTGPAKYLFVPLALAVVFAMLASYLLSRTLVPTHGAVPAARRGRTAHAGARRVAEPASAAMHAGVRARVRAASRPTYTALLATGARHRRGACLAVFGVIVVAVARARCRSSGATSSPTVDAGQIRLHVRAPAGHAHRGDRAAASAQVEDAIREVDPRRTRSSMILDNIGLPQPHQPGVQRQRARSAPPTARSWSSLKPEHHAADRRTTSQTLRDELPRRVPELTFFFQPADIVSQILNFGLPAPIDVQVVGAQPRSATYAIAPEARRSACATIPGASTCTCTRSIDAPRAARRRRSHARSRARADPARRRQQPARLAQLERGQVAPNFWVDPEQRRQLPGRGADAAVPRRLGRRAA